MKELSITPISIVKKDGRALLLLSAVNERADHYTLNVYEEKKLLGSYPFALNSGKSFAHIWAEPPCSDIEATFEINNSQGLSVATVKQTYPAPRKWTFYGMVSSHIDLGLPYAQYIQRNETANYFKAAKELYEKTEERPSESRYRYVTEGSWTYNNYRENYPEDNEKALELIQKGELGVCAGVAGNHFQTFGAEELCRSAYSRAWLSEQGVESKTLAIMDVPGIPLQMIQPYADAGYENIIFAPNNWGPHLSSVWTLDDSKIWVINNPESCGGGSRIDVRFESALPMLFYMEGVAGRKLLVWACPQYGVGGERFGISAHSSPIENIFNSMKDMLPKLEARYPYDIWLFENYHDNMPPELDFTDSITEWNSQFSFPKIRTLGNPDEPFELVRERFGDSIPTLYGDITNSWALHPLAAAEVLSASFEADRALPTAEKLATLASLYTDYKYPATEFERAWASLIMNDEHSYGVGEYYGRDVAESWMHHRNWVKRALDCAHTESALALDALAENIPGEGARMVAFNPTAKARKELIETEKGCVVADLPAFGYRVIGESELKKEDATFTPCESAPTLENRFYRISFTENGAIFEIYDKELGRAITNAPSNEMLYTNDNCDSFHTAGKASFFVKKGSKLCSVQAISEHKSSGALLTRTVSLPEQEKRIDIDNRIEHATDMIVSDRADRSRYDRAIYFAFPFDVPCSRRFCELGGALAEYGKDLTGHSTDTFMCARRYAVCENTDFGVALIQLDSQIIEFDCIHKDKTDYGALGDGSAIYSFAATSWFHHKHLPGPNAINYRLRYSITSYKGSQSDADIAGLAERIYNPSPFTFISKRPTALFRPRATASFPAMQSL